MSDSNVGLCTKDYIISCIIAQAKEEIKGARDEKREFYLRVIEALALATSDIRQWVRLAKKQREQMPHNSGLCPTEAGIDASHRVIDAIGEAVAEIEAQMGRMK